MKKPRIIIVSGYGINCEEETKFAFDRAGGHASIVHINDLIEHKKVLREFQILAFPGGFSYGDDTGSGKALANRLRNHLWDEIQEFIKNGKLIFGICNGFQVMAHLGILPYGNKPEIALTHNLSARYECRWVELQHSSSICVFTRGIRTIEVPVAHGEGRFYAPDPLLDTLTQSDQVVFRYLKKGKPAAGEFPFNPNGSLDDIAGICDPTGRIFGMMPHPERHIDFLQHPNWPAIKEILKRAGKPLPVEGPGLAIFRNAVEYFN